MKDYAVVLYFDEKTSEEIHKIIENVAVWSGNSYMIETGIPPHITIGAFSSEDETGLMERTGEFVKDFSGGDVEFCGIKAFEPKVLFLSPVKNEYLSMANRRVNQLMEGFFPPADHNNYLPEYWVPHCALATRLEEEQMKAAREKVSSLPLPVTARAVKVCLARCNPYKEITVWELV